MKMKKQMIINVILSAILTLYFLLPALGVILPSWFVWVYGIAALVALVVSFMKMK
jgi:hypothetical protein